MTQVFLMLLHLWVHQQHLLLMPLLPMPLLLMPLLTMPLLPMTLLPDDPPGVLLTLLVGCSLAITTLNT